MIIYWAVIKKTKAKKKCVLTQKKMLIDFLFSLPACHAPSLVEIK